MHVLLTSIGGAGDVNPFIALARAFKANGERVTLLAGPQYRRVCEINGLDFVPLGTLAQQRKLKSAPFMRNPRTSMRHIWRKVVLPHAPLLLETLESVCACDPPELVVYHPASIGVPWLCRRNRIACAVATLSPQIWQIYNTGRVHGVASPNEDARQRVARTFLRLTRPLARCITDRDLNKIRRRFGFAPGRDVFAGQFLDCDLNLGMWSPVFRERLPDDPTNGVICGFPWFDQSGDEDRIATELEHFLDDGEPPIVFTMGTTVIAAAGNFYESAAEACRRLGRRGLLLTGTTANRPRRLPPGVRAFKYAPFGTVLPRGCATVHHGGTGTTGQALRSGKPMLIIPVAWDQFDNARWAKRMRVSLTLERGRVSAKTLTCR